MTTKPALHSAFCLTTLSLVMLCWPLLAATAVAENGYKITRKIEIPGEGGWDYRITRQEVEVNSPAPVKLG
jgi:hypothetical protein